MHKVIDPQSDNTMFCLVGFNIVIKKNPIGSPMRLVVFSLSKTVCVIGKEHTDLHLEFQGDSESFIILPTTTNRRDERYVSFGRSRSFIIYQDGCQNVGEGTTYGRPGRRVDLSSWPSGGLHAKNWCQDPRFMIAPLRFFTSMSTTVYERAPLQGHDG